MMKRLISSGAICLCMLPGLTSLGQRAQTSQPAQAGRPIQTGQPGGQLVSKEGSRREKMYFSGYTFSWPRQCRISWRAKSAINAASFVLMRSDGMQRTFRRVPALIIREIRGDSTFVSAIDTTAVAGKTFAYQLIVSNALGNIENIAVAQRVITYDLHRVPLPQNLLTSSVDTAADR